MRNTPIEVSTTLCGDILHLIRQTKRHLRLQSKIHAGVRQNLVLFCNLMMQPLYEILQAKSQEAPRVDRQLGTYFGY